MPCLMPTYIIVALHHNASSLLTALPQSHCVVLSRQSCCVPYPPLQLSLFLRVITLFYHIFSSMILTLYPCYCIGFRAPHGLLQDLSADLVLWTAGNAPSTSASRNPLKVPFPSDERGSTRTDATLRVQRHAHVFALGDVAVPSEAPPPNTAQVLLPPLPQALRSQSGTWVRSKGIECKLS